MTTNKLKDPPIFEALLELRFESNELPEIVIGRLSDLSTWRSGTKAKTQAAQIPEQVRGLNAETRFWPTVEIKGVNNIGAVRVGSNVLSLHFYAPYRAWEELSPILGDAIDSMFEALPNLKITRLGLRYINLFTAERHYVSSVNDLVLQVRLGNDTVKGPIQLLMYDELDSTHHATTRIISREFLIGAPQKTTLAVDIDIATPEGYLESSSAEVKSWIEAARVQKNSRFRALLPPALLTKLEVEEH